MLRVTVIKWIKMKYRSIHRHCWSWRNRNRRPWRQRASGRERDSELEDRDTGTKCLLRRFGGKWLYVWRRDSMWWNRLGRVVEMASRAHRKLFLFVKYLYNFCALLWFSDLDQKYLMTKLWWSYNRTKYHKSWTGWYDAWGGQTLWGYFITSRTK